MDWLIQRDVFPEHEEEMARILGKRAIFFKYTINGPSYEDGRSPSDRCLVRGSIQICRRLQAEGHVAFMPDQVFDCSYYMGSFGCHALNWNHCYVTAGLFKQSHDVFIKGAFGESPFVKENSGYKGFTGRVFDEHTQDDISKLWPYTLLMVAPEQFFTHEFRLVIAETDEEASILTGSHYLGDFGMQPEMDVVQLYGQNILDAIDYHPAPFWTLDICTVPGCLIDSEYSLKVLEVNSLLAAGWYDSDVEAIVNAVDTYVAGLRPSTSRGDVVAP